MEYLNTSYVDIKQDLVHSKMVMYLHLNTSYVDIKLKQEDKKTNIKSI